MQRVTQEGENRQGALGDPRAGRSPGLANCQRKNLAEILTKSTPTLVREAAGAPASAGPGSDRMPYSNTSSIAATELGRLSRMLLFGVPSLVHLEPCRK